MESKSDENKEWYQSPENFKPDPDEDPRLKYVKYRNLEDLKKMKDTWEFFPDFEPKKWPFTMPELPWEKSQLDGDEITYSALEPHISRETIEFHYGKHHLSYYLTLCELLAEPGNEELNDEKTLEYIIRNSKGNVFNNAA